MRIAVEFAFETHIISVPDEIGGEIKKYQNKFDKWLYDKSNDHGYWVIINGRKTAVSFDIQAFVDYLNTAYLHSCEDRAMVIETFENGSENIPSEMTKIYF